MISIVLQSIALVASLLASSQAANVTTATAASPENIARCSSVNGSLIQGSKCFFTPGVAGTWMQAEMACQAHGGHLASVKSEEENLAVYNVYARTAALQDYGALWLGRTDDGENFPDAAEGTWRWVDGSFSSYQNWDFAVRHGHTYWEPNNSGGRQNCMAMWLHNKRWDDQECDETRYGVCLVQLAPSCADLGGELHGDKCFFAPEGSGTWEERESVCQEYGGHLASIASAGENSVAWRVFDRSGARGVLPVWLGYSDDPAQVSGASEGGWRWVDGSDATFWNWAYNVWALAHEPLGGAAQNCVVMTDIIYGVGRWDDQECDNLRPALCSVPESDIVLPPPTCSEVGGELHSDKCFFVPDGTGTWQEREQVCQQYGGHLASIASSAENEAVYQLYVSSGAALAVGAMWLGYSDDPALVAGASEGEWRWADGSAAAFTHWAANEPNNWGPQNCAVMWRFDSLQEWDDQQCDRLRHGICSAPATSLVLPTFVHRRSLQRSQPARSVSDGTPSSDVAAAVLASGLAVALLVVGGVKLVGRRARRQDAAETEPAGAPHSTTEAAAESLV